MLDHAYCVTPTLTTLLDARSSVKIVSLCELETAFFDDICASTIQLSSMVTAPQPITKLTLTGCCYCYPCCSCCIVLLVY